jgi:hypothetical protein
MKTEPNKYPSPVCWQFSPARKGSGIKAHLSVHVDVDYHDPLFKTLLEFMPEQCKDVLPKEEELQ